MDLGKLIHDFRKTSYHDKASLLRPMKKVALLIVLEVFFFESLDSDQILF